MQSGPGTLIVELVKLQNYGDLLLTALPASPASH